MLEISKARLALPKTLFARIGLTILWATLIPPQLSAADQPPTVRAEIRASLSKRGDTLTGTVVLDIRNDTDKPLWQIPLWLYPNRFIKPSPTLDEGMSTWIYPGGRTRGGMTIRNPKWNSRSLPGDAVSYTPLYLPTIAVQDRIIADISLSAALRPGTSGRLAIDFEVRIPVRRGRFGRHRGVVSLGGGWFPRPLTDLSGWDTSLPPDNIAAEVHLQIPPGRGAVIGDQIFEKRTSAQSVSFRSESVEDIPVVVMDQMALTTRRYDWGTATHVHQELSWKPPTWRESVTDDNGLPDRMPEPGRFDVSKRLLDVVGNTADLIREIAPGCPMKSRLVLVDIPAWDRLVQRGPGPVLVSDRLWRLIPVRDGRFFHDLALVREVAAELLWQDGLRKGAPRTRYVSADMAGTVVADHYSRTVHKRQRTVKEIIGFASMFPAVDNLLYAPMIPFKEVYYRSVEEPDPLRDEPWRFMNHYPRGKRLVGKLQDLAGWETVRDNMGRFLDGQLTFEEMFDTVIGGDSAWFFDQWYGTYPAVNYRLGKITDTPLPGGQVLHHVEVLREGTVLREPVTVRITDRNGAAIDRVWDSDERRRVLLWRSDAPVDKVEIDPDHRLVEAASLTGDHPLADNIRPLPWRPPMFTKLVVWGDLTAGDIYAEIGFWMRRKYDISNVFNLEGAYTPTAYGGVFGYYRFFGGKRHLNARSWFMGPSVSAIHYNRVEDLTLSLPEETLYAATMGSVGFAIGRDTRVYGWDPLSGSSVALQGSYAAGASDDGEPRHVGRASVSGGRVFRAGIHHKLVMYGGVSSVFGDPVASNLTYLAHRSRLRGFDLDETYGRLGIYGVVEYRHVLRDAAFLTAPLYSWFDRFQGVLFFGAGTISRPSGFDGLFTPKRIFSEVGYGLRLHLLFLGVAQYLIALDVAVPITPLDRTRLSQQADGTVVEQRRSPYRIILGITQTF